MAYCYNNHRGKPFKVSWGVYDVLDDDFSVLKKGETYFIVVKLNLITPENTTDYKTCGTE